MKGGNLMLVMKCSFHDGKRYSIEHNMRTFDKDKWNKDGHINWEKTKSNVVLVSKDLYSVFREKFTDELIKFNERERKKHPDRLIGFDTPADYDALFSPTKDAEKAKINENDLREKPLKAYYEKYKKDAREVIIQLGEHKEYAELVREKGLEQANKIHEDYLRKAYTFWKKNNPNLVPFCATIHMDETIHGTPHLHITYLPISQSDRGLGVRVSLEGALKDNFKREKKQKYAETPYKRWLHTNRTNYEEFAQRYCDENELDAVIIPAEKSEKGHKQPEEHNAEQQKSKSVKEKVFEIAKILRSGKKIDKDAARYIIENADLVAKAINKESNEDRKIAHETKLAYEILYQKAQKKIEDAAKAQQEYDRKKADLDKEIQAAAQVLAEKMIKELTNDYKRQLKSKNAEIEQEKAEKVEIIKLNDMLGEELKALNPAAYENVMARYEDDKQRERMFESDYFEYEDEDLDLTGGYDEQSL